MRATRFKGNSEPMWRRPPKSSGTPGRCSPPRTRIPRTSGLGGSVRRSAHSSLPHSALWWRRQHRPTPPNYLKRSLTTPNFRYFLRKPSKNPLTRGNASTSPRRCHRSLKRSSRREVARTKGVDGEVDVEVDGVPVGHVPFHHPVARLARAPRGRPGVGAERVDDP